MLQSETQLECIPVTQKSTFYDTETRDTCRMKEESERSKVDALEVALEVTPRKSWKALGILPMTPEWGC